MIKVTIKKGKGKVTCFMPHFTLDEKEKPFAFVAENSIFIKELEDSGLITNNSKSKLFGKITIAKQYDFADVIDEKGFLNQVKKAKKDIKSGTPLSWNLIEKSKRVKE